MSEYAIYYDVAYANEMVQQTSGLKQELEITKNQLEATRHRLEDQVKVTAELRRQYEQLDGDYQRQYDRTNQVLNENAVLRQQLQQVRDERLIK
jgi:predicted nuclease with TOPRIM domain